MRERQKPDKIVSRIVSLLDEVAELMRRDPGIDRRALEYLIQLQSRIRLISSFGSQSSVLPSRPPTKWLDRADRKESPIDFIRREYSPWLGKGLSRPFIRKLDKSLYAALCNWISENGDLPEDIDLPTRKQLNDRRLEEVGYASGGASAEQREALRLYQAARRRSSVRR
jgi:hypothetical protein